MEPVQTPSNGPTPLRAAATAILDSAKSTLAAAPTTEATRTIHEFRVAMKRWRAFLRLVEPFAGDEARALRREASLLTRDLGASRDAQAACDAFADIVKAAAKEERRRTRNGTHNGAKTGAKAAATTVVKKTARTEPLSDTVRKAIDGKLATLRGEAESSALGRAAQERLTDAMMRAQQQVAQWPLDAVAFADLAAGLARSYRRARRRRPEDWSQATDEELHELRKAVVTLRYQADIVAPLWPKMWKTFTSELQRLRSQLGQANDLAVLGTFAEPRAPLSRWRKHIAGRAAARRGRHAERAQRIAGRVFSETPRAFRRRLLALWQAAQADDTP